jgi:hypothetical protein
MVFGCFGYFETPKQAVSILKRNNQNKRLVSDSDETSFGSSFGDIVSAYFDFIQISFAGST